MLRSYQSILLSFSLEFQPAPIYWLIGCSMIQKTFVSSIELSSIIVVTRLSAPRNSTFCLKRSPVRILNTPNVGSLTLSVPSGTSVFNVLIPLSSFSFKPLRQNATPSQIKVFKMSYVWRGFQTERKWLSLETPYLIWNFW